MPERTFCGHWLHFACFEKFVNTKPFKRQCPFEGCDEVLGSNNFGCDEKSVKDREKRWTQDQSKKGEDDSLAALFGI